MQPDTDQQMQVQALALIKRHGPPELVRWFSGLDLGHVEDGKTEFQHRKERRDYLLQQALDQIPGEQTWTRCSKLATEIRRFESVTWRRVRFQADPPERFNKLNSILFQILKLEIAVPTTTQGIVNATQISACINLGEPDVR